MASYYSNLYAQVGNSTTYEPKGPVPTEGGLAFAAYFTATVPAGFTVADSLFLVPLQMINVPTATPQSAGCRFWRFAYTVSGDAGGSVTANIGGGGGTGQLSATAFGSAVTTLQAAATTTITDAVLSPLVVLQSDHIKLVGVANTTVTARTISGMIGLYNSAQ